MNLFRSHGFKRMIHCTKSWFLESALEILTGYESWLLLGITWHFTVPVLVSAGCRKKMSKFAIFCRLSRYKQFKDFQKRILVATNLFGRGMDIERVNIVINYDMPEDSDTYLHRVSYHIYIWVYSYLARIGEGNVILSYIFTLTFFLLAVRRGSFFGCNFLNMSHNCDT